MVKSAIEEIVRTLDLRKEIEIAASITATSVGSPPPRPFDAILAELGPASEMPDGTPFPMKIEPWPGGRWFRDLGNNTGHLWGRAVPSGGKQRKQNPSHADASGDGSDCRGCL